MVLLFVVCIMTVSCAAGKAIIDLSAADKIVWPGPPETPRISYLWSISVVSEAAGDSAFRFISGDDESARSSSRLLRPFGVFVDDKDTLFITDLAARRISVIDIRTGESRNMLSAGKEEFITPVGVIAFRDRQYVSDSSLKKVVIFNKDGEKTGEFSGDFLRPTALAVDKKKGVIYVTDTLEHTVYRYDPEGKRLGFIGGNGSGEGEFNFPTHLWVDSQGMLYVTDAMNFRVQIFDSDGRFLSMFGQLGDAYGELDKPKGVAVDSDGNIYIVDSIKDTVKIFNREGKLLLFFGVKGFDFGQFYLPSGIFIDDKNQIYVADTYNSRIQVFKYLGGAPRYKSGSERK